MHNLVVACVFKNEAPILKEWILHYLKWGVEHFYLVNDYSTDNYLDIIKDYPVTLFQNDFQEGSELTLIYDRYFKEIPSKWVAILDLNEFMWSPSGGIQETLDDSVSQIKIDLLHFGSSGHVTQPESVVQGFTKRAKFNTSTIYYSYKSIYQTKYLTCFGVNGHRVNGQTIHYKGNDNPKLIINHYISFKFFKIFSKHTGVKFDRSSYKTDKTYFIYRDINLIEDFRLSILNSQK